MLGTFVGHAVGAGNPEMAGVWTQVFVLVMNMVIVMMIIVMIMVMEC